MKRLIQFFKEERGLEMSEYALMGALICIALVVAVGILTGAIEGAFTRIAAVVTAAGT